MRYGRKSFRSENFLQELFRRKPHFRFFLRERTIVLRCALAHRHAIAVADRMDEAGDTLFCYLEGAHGATQKVKDFASASLKLIPTREKEQVLTSRHAEMFESPPQL
ncbi:MAG: hypothetical protein ACJ8F2_18235 [Xanthobacteraceae bacterium]